MKCKHCGGEITDELGERTGYCSSECYELGIWDDDDDLPSERSTPEQTEKPRPNPDHPA